MPYVPPLLRRHPSAQHWGWIIDGEGLAWVDAEQGLDLQLILNELGLEADVEHHWAAS